MKTQELIDFLTYSEEEEVFIKVDDTLCEFEFESIPECFDGFDTVYPSSIALVPKSYNDRE